MIRHYLNYISPSYGRLEISEPVGFDAFSFDIEQGSERFGRDESIGGKELGLEFFGGNNRFELSPVPQVMLNGTIVKHLGHGFELTLEAIREKGDEAKIEYIISDNGDEVSMGLLDVPERDTDGITSILMNTIRNTELAMIERKKDVKADVYASIDTFNNPQTPVVKEKICLRALPYDQKSEWKYGLSSTKIFSLVASSSFNFSSQVLKYGIESTLSYILGAGNSNDFKYVFAENELTDVQIRFTNVNVGFIPFILNIGDVELKVRVGIDIDTATEYNIDKIFAEESFDMSYSLDIPLVKRGEYIWIYFRVEGGGVRMQYTSMDVSISAVSTSLDTVISGAKYFDFLQKGVKSTSGFDLEADDIETGEFKDQFVFSGNDIRSRFDSKLNFVFKDEMSDLMAELKMDYQILPDKIQLLLYPDFYKDIELLVLEAKPDEKFSITSNPRFKKNLLELGYDTYEQDKDEKNTIDAFHTQAQFLLPLESVEGSIPAKIKKIRDPFKIETIKKEFSKRSTLSSTDDKICIIDCVPIAPASRNTVRSAIQMMVVQENPGDEPILKLLADERFVWSNLGFKNTNIINITYGENIGSYSVWQFDDSVLELIPLSSIPTFSGNAIIIFDYPLTDVIWQNRTGQGFDFIGNLEAPTKTSNLKYTIKRNLTRPAWSSFLATVCRDVPEKSILVTDFVANGELLTQFQGGELLKENEPIPVSSLSEKILNKLLYKTMVPIGFAQAKQLMYDIANIKGYVRIYNNIGQMVRIHSSKFHMNWVEGVAEITGEARNESDFITITSIGGGVVNIAEVGYNLDTVDIQWFRITNGYVQLFDELSRPLISLTNFKYIKIDGILFTDANLFAQALYDL